jgi:hypothetical protein
MNAMANYKENYPSLFGLWFAALTIDLCRFFIFLYIYHLQLSSDIATPILASRTAIVYSRQHITKKSNKTARGLLTWDY